MTRFVVVFLLILPVLLAQDPSPPQKTDAIDPALAPLLDALKKTLNSNGRVEYRINNGERIIDHWQQITSVAVDARGCQATVHLDGTEGAEGNEFKGKAISLFLESIDSVETLSHHGGMFISPVIALSINGEKSVFDSLVFATGGAADAVTYQVSHVARICRAMPVALNSAVGAPNLTDTLHFIEAKLNDNGSIDYRLNAFKDHFFWRTVDVVSDTSACLIRFNSKGETAAGNRADRREVVSFRRLEKIEVFNEQDDVNRYEAQRGRTGPYVITPVVYKLRLTFVGGGRVFLLLGDEDLSNRIAKAMLHAVELCGGGSKDPF